MTRQERFTQIAKQHLGIETLETRKSDALDFHEVSVWGIVQALDAAYRAGRGELLEVCEAIDALWRKHGFGDDDAESEPIWDAFQRALTNARRDS